MLQFKALAVGFDIHLHGVPLRKIYNRVRDRPEIYFVLCVAENGSGSILLPSIKALPCQPVIPA